jgi:hypothetical protein
MDQSFSLPDNWDFRRFSWTRFKVAVGILVTPTCGLRTTVMGELVDPIVLASITVTHTHYTHTNILRGVCVCVCVRVCVCMCVSVCMYACTNAYVCMHAYLSVCVCVCVCVFMRAQALTCACMQAARSVLGRVATPALAAQLAGSYAAAFPYMSRQLSIFLVDGLILVGVVLQVGFCRSLVARVPTSVPHILMGLFIQSVE